MTLTATAKEKLGTDEVKMKIALELGKSYLTMRRWILGNHVNLTRKQTIAAITKFTGLQESEIFEFETSFTV